MNLASKIVFLRKTILEAKFICKNSRVVFISDAYFCVPLLIVHTFQLTHYCLIL